MGEGEGQGRVDRLLSSAVQCRQEIQSAGRLWKETYSGHVLLKSLPANVTMHVKPVQL